MTKETAPSAIYTTRTTCRACGGKKLTKVWSFGKTPLANAYLKPREAGKREEPRVPLNVYFCKDCFLVQLRDVVSPKVLFGKYLYLSSTSATFRKHFAEYAARLKERLELNKDSLVVDVGSNDGILLAPLKEAGVRVLGVDPAKNVAKMANEAGIPTVASFFTPATAKKIAKEQGQADVITANNVFAHTDRIDVFVEAVKELLKPEGVFVFEVQYLGDLLQKNLFDIVYHEHVNYYHVHPLVTFFASQGLEVFDVERPAVHGGSIRVYVQRDGGPHERTEALSKLLREEKRKGLNTVRPYQAFAKRIKENKEKLRVMLLKLKKAGKRVVGYGAPAKATTLMHAFGLNGKAIEYIADDDDKIKQGLLMPGTHIPIVAPDYLYKPFDGAQGKPDYCLILAWNFAEPIMKAHARFAKEGGKFIIPVPKPKIVTGKS